MHTDNPNATSATARNRNLETNDQLAALHGMAHQPPAARTRRYRHAAARILDETEARAGRARTAWLDSGGSAATCPPDARAMDPGASPETTPVLGCSPCLGSPAPFEQVFHVSSISGIRPADRRDAQAIHNWPGGQPAARGTGCARLHNRDAAAPPNERREPPWQHSGIGHLCAPACRSDEPRRPHGLVSP